MKEEKDFWPKINDEYVATQPDPITGLPMCRDCWNGKHKKEGCPITGCMCGCYRGMVKSKSGLTKPERGNKDQTSIPESAGFIKV